MKLVSVLLLLFSFVYPSWAVYFQVNNFGSNPSGARMFMYTPNNIASNPPIIVSIHYCTGTAQAMYTGTPYARYADQYGFIVIYPESPYSGSCWDVASRASLTRDGGGNSNAIANMIRYAIQTYGADASRVYVQGASSGAMMTNVLAATYPDLINSAIVYSGVPAGCFRVDNASPPAWNSTCAQGNVRQTAQQWAQVVYNMYPGYTGRRPRMQIYHGDADTTLNGQNYHETIRQWSGVFGYSNPSQTLPNNPVSPYTKYVYGPNLEGILGRGIGHNVANMGIEDLRWFGLVGGSSSSSSTSIPTATTTRATVTSTRTSAAPTTTGQTQWGQCGGNGWTGPTTCVSPFRCVRVNDWYHQCQ